MSESGRGLQIVNVTKSHSYELDEAELAQLLLRDDVKDLPVVVVSVAGAYRGGKSFLLNFFLRYLYSPQSAQKDGSWLGEDSAPLAGFQWRGGIKATTMGVLMWSEPFITTLPSGEKVAVLLVDTQGNFDSKSTVRDNSTIFALSTLVSSIQIYNISQNIKEDDLQHLELFTEYGKVVNSNDSESKAFQVLEFLVRDWQFPEEFPYGAVGGESLLREKLEVTEDDSKEMKELREHVMSSFEKVSCFLMPHPGFNVLKSSYSGNIGDIDAQFRSQLVNLVNSIFSQEKLLPKTINGEQVKALELFNYFKTYLELFNSDKIPSPTNILEATVKAVLLSAKGEARDVYEKGMSSQAGPKQPGIPAVDLKFLHQKYVDEAVQFYNNKKKMGTLEQQAEYLDKLSKELNERLPQYVQSNLAKFQSTVEEARVSYDKVVQEMAHDQPICVHPKDLEKVHKTALDAAIKTYEELVKRVTKKHDDDKIKFIQGFEKLYDLLEQENEQNNKLAVTTLCMEYWQRMQAKALQDPPLSEADYMVEHKNELEQTLKHFDSKRAIPSQYTEDVYKQKLAKACQDSFVNLKRMNNSKNKEKIFNAVQVYDRYMETFLNGQSKCRHPEELSHLHTQGICRALTSIRPDKDCYKGFDYDDDDELTLKRMLDQRYADYKKNNDAANKTAVIMAFMAYVNNMNDKCRFTAWWFLIVPYIENVQKRATFHEQSKQKAYDVFFAHRNEGESYPNDTFKNSLDEMMQNYFENHYKEEMLEKVNLGAIKDVVNKVLQTSALAGAMPVAPM